MIELDLLFFDPVAYRHYDAHTLHTEPLGGTEATVVRIAEHLAARGMRVGIMNPHTQDITIGSNAYHFGVSEAGKVRTENLVSIRGIKGLDLFPDAKRKFSWQHDVPDTRLTAMVPKLLEHSAKIICVSNWHKTEAQRLVHSDDFTKVPQVTRIYNPVDEFIGKVVHNAKITYDKNVLVWAASPHKGLDKALEQFRILRSFLPSLELRVFNPGYLEHNLHREKGVVAMGAVPCRELWQNMSEALCVFYPTNFCETFGLIAAEANAVHTPVATMRLAGLTESVQSDNQMVGVNDYPALLKKVDEWYNDSNKRPEVCVQPRFRIESVGDEWIKLLTK
jgi:glycosyltransferase involved in cell wall biosynthesis